MDQTGFGSTGGVDGVAKVIKLDESDSENNDSHSDNKMLILPAKKVIAQADWLEITAKRARMQNDDGKIIIDGKYVKNSCFWMNRTFTVIKNLQKMK